MLVCLVRNINTVSAFLILWLGVGTSSLGISCSKGQVILARRGIRAFSFFRHVASLFFLLIDLLVRGNTTRVDCVV